MTTANNKQTCHRTVKTIDAMRRRCFHEKHFYANAFTNNKKNFKIVVRATDWLRVQKDTFYSSCVIFLFLQFQLSLHIFLHLCTRPTKGWCPFFFIWLNILLTKKIYFFVEFLPFYFFFKIFYGTSERKKIIISLRTKKIYLIRGSIEEYWNSTEKCNNGKVFFRVIDNEKYTHLYIFSYIYIRN